MNPLGLKTVDRALWPAGVAAAKAGALLFPFRRTDVRPLIVRPGGMGDLILLCVAAEGLGCDPRRFFWVIERRSSVWARHLGLDHLCYDEGLLKVHWKITGRFSIVVNSEQFFGLAQATAALACGRGAQLTCFDTNRAAAAAKQCVPYDPDGAHEVVMFQSLLAAALNLQVTVPSKPAPRPRTSPATEKPVVGLSGLQSPSRAFSETEWTQFLRAQLGERPFWITSTEIDRPMARRLAQAFSGQAQLFDGNFSALCGLIQDSEEVLTVDGGFLHIASYYGVPVTGLFTSNSDRKWAALAPGSRALFRDGLACRPCARFCQVPVCASQFACKEIPFRTLPHTDLLLDFGARSSSGI